MILTSERVDRMVALTSGFVAVLALFVSAYTVHLQREQLRAQVWPRVERFNGNVDGVVLSVVNRGVGPAIVRHARVSLDGKAMKTWDAVVSALNKQGHSITGSLHGRVIGAGQEVLELKFPDTTDEEPLHHINVELCYCSVVGDCWEWGRGDEVEAVSCCQRTPDEFED